MTLPRAAVSSRIAGGIASKPIRVAALVHTRIVSGPGRQLASLASALQARGIEVLVVALQRVGAPRSPYFDYLERAGVNYEMVLEAGPFDPRVVGRVQRALMNFQPDVIQTHGYKPTIIAALLRLGRPRWQWIGFWHGVTREDRRVGIYHWLDRRLLRTANRVVVMSDAQRAEFSDMGPRVSVIANAVIPRDSLDADADPCVIDGERPILGIVGRLSHEKGVDVFLRAASLLTREGTGFSAVIVGDGPDRASLEALARELGLANRVRFTGPLNNMRAVYDAIDLLVIPSRSEGLPNVLLEALAHDCPVAATRVGAIPTVLDSPLAGALAEPDSARSLADAIRRALSLRADPGAAAARRRIVDAFSLERRIDAHLSLYGAALGR
jgi:glycosyltransferase involved in cell wall biosynthesis